MIFPPLTWRKALFSLSRHVSSHLIAASFDDELRAPSQVADNEA